MNIMIGDYMILTIGYIFFNWLLGFPIYSTNNLHVYDTEMQQKELEKSWAPSTETAKKS